MINIDLQLFAFEIFRFPVNILQAFPPALLCFTVSGPRLLEKKCCLFSFSNAAKGARLNNQSLIKVPDWKINTHQYTPDIILNSWKYFVRTALNVSQRELRFLSFACFAGFGFAVWQHMHRLESCFTVRKNLQLNFHTCLSFRVLP